MSCSLRGVPSCPPFCQVAKGAETGNIGSVECLLIGISHIARVESQGRTRELDAIENVLELNANLERVPSLNLKFRAKFIDSLGFR
jgi:hypothetical protein